MRSTASIHQSLINKNPFQQVVSFPLECYQPTLALSFRQNNPMQNPSSLLNDDYGRAQKCISLISDPLWQDVCEDLLTMMGPASVLKIWKSNLGEFSPFDKALDFSCETEAAAAFAQQYDFVILGSLQRYFPSLKSLRVYY